MREWGCRRPARRVMGRDTIVASDLTLGLVPTSEGAHVHLVPELRALEQYHKALEDERLKVRAFERELPFCMQLLDNAIEASREQLADRLACKLRTPPSPPPPPPPPRTPLTRSLGTIPSLGASSFPSTLNRRGVLPPSHRGGQFPQWLPKHSTAFKIQELSQVDRLHYLDKQGGIDTNEHADYTHYVGLSKVPSKQDHLITKIFMPNEKVGVNNHLSQTNDASRCLDNTYIGKLNINTSMNATSPMQSGQRKSRRSWSPELHQLFLSALHQLGGCQVATPKQIRELMNIEGLTNDEVKSHLQKFRLHMRRPSSTSHANTTMQEGQHVLVFGHLWMPEPSPPSSIHQDDSGNSSASLTNGDSFMNVKEAPLLHPLAKKVHVQQQDVDHVEVHALDLRETLVSNSPLKIRKIEEEMDKKNGMILEDHEAQELDDRKDGINDTDHLQEI